MMNNAFRKTQAVIGLTLMTSLLLSGCSQSSSNNPESNDGNSTSAVPTEGEATNQFSKEEIQSALDDVTQYVGTSYNQTILLDGTWLNPSGQGLYQDGPGKLYLYRNWTNTLVDFLQPAIDGNTVALMGKPTDATQAAKIYQAYFAAYDPSSHGLTPVYDTVSDDKGEISDTKIIKNEVEQTTYDYTDQVLNNGEKKGLNIKTNFTVKVYYTKDGQEGFVQFHYDNMNYLYVQGDGSTAEKPNMNIQSISGKVTVDDWQPNA